jgi:hypothetical protein
MSNQKKFVFGFFISAALCASAGIPSLDTADPTGPGIVLKYNFEGTAPKGLNSAAKIVPAEFGNALQIDGESSGQLSVSPPAGLKKMSEITVHAWVKPNEPNKGRLVDSGDSILLAASGGGAFEFKLRFSDKSNQPLPTEEGFTRIHAAKGSWSDGQPCTVTGTWNAKEGMVRIFVNGELSDETPSPKGAAFVRHKNNNVVIGNRPEGDRAWNGLIDNFIIASKDWSKTDDPDEKSPQKEQ